MSRRPNTHYLLRFDDICPTMRWDIWAEIEKTLVETGVKPVLAVVPDNRDPVLQPAAPVADFWARVRRWQELGWTIALHGYQHLYVAKDGGLVCLRKKSEFASLPQTVQQEKLQKGIAIFQQEGIETRMWIAPGNAFDAVTVSLLPAFGIDLISAGWFWRPFVGLDNITWLPCQLSILRPAPAGAWTVCFHHNSWNAETLREFKSAMSRYRKRIMSLEEILEVHRPWKAKWCYGLCTRPRLSSFVLRAHLKLWKMTHPEDLSDQNAASTDQGSWPGRAGLVRPN